tara:strand:- start:1298 stop:2167 length:870 start_codon:yes stop_codon:yes gene_type:complete
MTNKNIDKIKSLPIWKKEIIIEKLDGGLTNHNFIVVDSSDKFVVRIGEDIIEHHVLRSNELISTKAAHDAGIGPKVVYSSPGVLVLEYIESQTLSEKDVGNNIDKIINLIKKVHYEMPKKLFGPAMIFWVFHVIKNYAKFLGNKNSLHKNILPSLIEKCQILENLSSPYQIVYGHNDLLPANFLNDGSRLWLIDWEYAGFNSPLFDLGGLASNCNFSNDQEIYLLESYFGKKIDSNILRQYNAMKCASLLRETMWSMVSEITSEINFDYSVYTKNNLNKFEETYKKFKK